MPEVQQWLREEYERVILRPLITQLMLRGEVYILNGQMIEPERVEFVWPDAPTNPVRDKVE